MLALGKKPLLKFTVQDTVYSFKSNIRRKTNLFIFVSWPYCLHRHLEKPLSSMQISKPNTFINIKSEIPHTGVQIFKIKNSSAFNYHWRAEFPPRLLWFIDREHKWFYVFILILNFAAQFLQPILIKGFQFETGGRSSIW